MKVLCIKFIFMANRTARSESPKLLDKESKSSKIFICITTQSQTAPGKYWDSFSASREVQLSIIREVNIKKRNRAAPRPWQATRVGVNLLMSHPYNKRRLVKRYNEKITKFLDI